MCSRTEKIDDTLLGGNASAEEVCEDTDEATVSGVDIVMNHSLQQTAFDKKSFLQYLKEYVKAWVSLRRLHRSLAYRLCKCRPDTEWLCFCEQCEVSPGGESPGKSGGVCQELPSSSQESAGRLQQLWGNCTYQCMTTFIFIVFRGSSLVSRSTRGYHTSTYHSCTALKHYFLIQHSLSFNMWRWLWILEVYRI